MEDDLECHTGLDLMQDEEQKGELKVAADPSHVTLRQTSVTDCTEETGFPFNRKTDSLALLSVYRYARKIKYFLGWEDKKEDLGYEEKSKGSSPENFSEKETCFSPNVVEVAKHSPFSESEKNKEYAEINDNALPSEKEANQRNSFYLEVSDHTSGDGSEITTKYSSYSCEIENDSNSRKENFENSKILRSEVNLIIDDFDSDTIVLPELKKENLELDNYRFDTSTYTEMDKSLLEGSVPAEAGLCFNDEDTILEDEPGGLPSLNADIKSLNNNKRRPIEGNSEDANTFENEILDPEVQRESSLKEDNLRNIPKISIISKNESKSNEKLVDDMSNHESNSENSGNFEEHNATGDTILFSENKCLAPSAKENDSFLMNGSTKENQESVAIIAKLDNTLKAHIQYETEKKKCSKSKEAEYNENLNLRRQNSDSLDEDTICGLGLFKPRWLQPYATAKVYVVLYSILGILHGSYYSYLIGSLSTLEKRFAFKSKISGAIMVVDETIPLLLGMIISYYATRAHRPRIVALGMLLSAFCCFCSSLPYFIYGSIKNVTFKNIIGPEYCDPNFGIESCNSPDRPQNLFAVLLLILGSFLKGFGNLAYYAIGLAYLDDNSDKKSTPIYLAISLALRLLGPLVGFLMSSGFLKLYENPYDNPGYGPEDPRWIGAWWIGFFLQGVLLVIFTLPIALFPRRLPGQKKIEKADTDVVGDKLKELFHGLISALKRLGKNPVFIVLIINTNMKIFGHFGHAIMLPKYMENQFRLSASDASLYSGATSITCIMLSTVLGGFLIWKFRPRIKVLLAGMIISEAILCIGFLILMIPRCQTTDMLHFGMDDEGLILRNVCNNNCDCSTTSFTPFCGPDGKTTYFSPCYAGCTHELTSTMSTTKNKEFGNCSCIAEQSLEATTISEGFCPDDTCWSQTMAYLIILFVLVAISNIFTVAHTIILLRSVHPSDKSFALGTFETFICLFGFIPLPVTFGALVDSACLVWEKSCGVTGNCWFYDMEKYNYLLHGVAALFCSLSVICLTVLYFLSGRVRNLYDEEEEKEAKEYTDIKLDTVSGSITKL